MAHHADTAAPSTATFAATAAARRTVISRVTKAALANHRAGARPTRTMAVALTPPTVATIRATTAGHRQPPRRAARIVAATIHPSPAHGASSTEVRDAYSST